MYTQDQTSITKNFIPLKVTVDANIGLTKGGYSKNSTTHKSNQVVGW